MKTTANNKQTIEIPAPKHDLYQIVTVFWNEGKYRVKITRRWFNADTNTWSYEFNGRNGQLFPQSAIEPS